MWQLRGLSRAAGSLRHKVAPSLAMRISGLMQTNKTKAASRSQSKRSTKTAAKRSPATPAAELSAQQRARRIAVAAYFLAERRAFALNHELDDWLAAERSL